MLKFSVQLQRPEPMRGQKAEAQGDKPPLKFVKEDKPKVKAAKRYLEEHDLERRLKDAMQDVISAMPQDPAAFIAERLAKNNVLLRAGVANEPVPDLVAKPLEQPEVVAGGAPAA